MKRYAFVLLTLPLLPQSVSAQWTTCTGQSSPGTCTSNNIGFGTSSPQFPLELVTGSGVGINFKFSTAYGNSQIRNDYSSGADYGNYMRFSVNNAAGNAVERLTIRGDGNVGIGMTSPTSSLDVAGGIAVEPTTGISYINVFYGDPAQTSRAQFQLYTDAIGYHGISLQSFGSSATGTTFGFPNANLSTIQGLSQDTGLGVGTTGAAPLLIATAGTERARVDAVGNLGIGTSAPAERLHVIGNAIISGTVTGGNIKAKYQDVAEWVPSNEELPAGTVVVIDNVTDNHVTTANRRYATNVAGVVSANPGISLGEPSPGKVQVATTGRVKVLVDAIRAPIHRGDVLVASDTAGYAMRSEPVVIGGISMHRPGTIIGKALEPLDHGTGEILVLLTLQ